jgi:hypothetical protein
MILYRPVGQKEYDLIKESGFMKFPPRFYWQPIFYPVLNQEYATQIARDWNTKDEASGYVGYVLEFEIDDRFISRYEIHTVGNGMHQEYWIPAEDLKKFNRHLKKDKLHMAISPIDKYVGENLLNADLENTFFLSKVQLLGTCYHQFKQGEWNDEYWSEESIYLRDDEVFIFALIFAKVIKDYSPYDMRQIESDETTKLANVISQFNDVLSSSRNIITAYKDIGVYDSISSKVLDDLVLIDNKNNVSSNEEVEVYGTYSSDEFEKQLLELDFDKLSKTVSYFTSWLKEAEQKHGCFTLLGI